VDVTIDPKGLIFIGIVPLWRKLHRRRKFGLPKQVFDAGQDVTMIHVKCLPSHDHLFSFELPLTGQAVNQAIELAWGFV
jgi:hypothetical protein